MALIEQVQRKTYFECQIVEGRNPKRLVVNEIGYRGHTALEIRTKVWAVDDNGNPGWRYSHGMFIPAELVPEIRKALEAFEKDHGLTSGGVEN
mgnify:FL=1